MLSHRMHFFLDGLRRVKVLQNKEITACAWCRYLLYNKCITVGQGKAGSLSLIPLYTVRPIETFSCIRRELLNFVRNLEQMKLLFLFTKIKISFKLPTWENYIAVNVITVNTFLKSVLDRIIKWLLTCKIIQCVSKLLSSKK